MAGATVRTPALIGAVALGAFAVVAAYGLAMIASALLGAWAMAPRIERMLDG